MLAASGVPADAADYVCPADCTDVPVRLECSTIGSFGGERLMLDDSDLVAEERDRTAERRDRTAERRDRAATNRERPAGRFSVTERDQARRDREAAARDRTEASRDRKRAADDRHQAASDRAQAGVDLLTGALRRDRGLIDLQREIDRARRSGGRLVLAFIDVDGLKQVNDSQGHAAGDQLLHD